MSKRTPKTQGAEWLFLSMGSFNGSGYADKSSPEAYLESYKHYKAWRNEATAVELVNKHLTEALFFAEKFVHAKDAGHTPSQKNIERFAAFRSRAGLLL